MTSQTLRPGPMGCVFPAIPVRDASGARLPIDMIRAYVMIALDTVRRQPEKLYRVQQEGWGYHRREIAPMFDRCPGNIMLPYGFLY